MKAVWCLLVLSIAIAAVSGMPQDQNAAKRRSADEASDSNAVTSRYDSSESSARHAANHERILRILRKLGFVHRRNGDDYSESTDDYSESTDDSSESTDDSSESTDDSSESTDDSASASDSESHATSDSTESASDETNSVSDTNSDSSDSYSVKRRSADHGSEAA